MCNASKKSIPQPFQSEEKRMYADRGFKSHRVERERDVVLRRLRGRSLLLFFRRPCGEVGVSCVLEEMAGLEG
jgi:hypothetical protein